MVWDFVKTLLSLSLLFLIFACLDSLILWNSSESRFDGATVEIASYLGMYGAAMSFGLLSCCWALYLLVVEAKIQVNREKKSKE